MSDTIPDAASLLYSDKELEEDSYVLVEFKDKKSKIHCAEKIFRAINELDEEEKEYEVRFMRCSKKTSEKFVFPQQDDISVVGRTDILFVLPNPEEYDKGTNCQKAFMKFYVKFSSFNIR